MGASGAVEYEYCETASMAALFENHVEVVLVFESPQLMRMGNTPGAFCLRMRVP